MSDDLRIRMHHVADDVTPLPVSADLWRRGQAARRRAQVLAVAAVVVVLASVGGGVALWSAPDREARTASGEVPAGGAIPSRIEDVPADLPASTDASIGRASVAFLSPTSQLPVLIGAQDGRYHQLDLPDGPTDAAQLVLSPDGTSLAWANLGRIHVVDLETGEESFFPTNDEHADVSTLAWTPSSDHLLWTGTARGGADSGGMLPIGDNEEFFNPSVLRGIPSPTGRSTAVSSPEVSDAALFLARRGKEVERALPTDLYPQGASTRPLGWAHDHLVVAQAYGPPGSYVEDQHLVLFTSPDQPESEWTFRVLARDIPQNGVLLSLAVDLIPDLDGTSSQELTHDFGDTADDPRDVSWIIGLGVAAAIALLLGLRLLSRRLA